MQRIEQATRPIMWNVDYSFVMYIMFMLALTVFAYGVIWRIQSWRKGKPDNDRLSQWLERGWLLIKEVFQQKRVRASPLPAIFHSFIFYAFVALVATTAVVALDYDLGTHLFKGILYATLTVAAEIAGVAIMIGAGIAFYRRYILKPSTLSRDRTSAIAIALLFVLVLTGFAVEGLRMAAMYDPWYYLSPVGWLFSLLFAGFSKASLVMAHKVMWWFHTTVAMSWIATIPYSKFSHLITLPLNIYFQKLRPRGELKRDDIEKLMTDPNVDFNALTIGIQKPEDFTWKQRLDFDACIECGRCEQVCPSRKADSNFSPKLFIAKCRDLAKTVKPAVEGAANETAAEKTPEEAAIVGDGLSEDYIWRCRTCMACMAVCPACIDHVDTLIDIRRNEVMIQGRLPEEAKRALKMLETNGNPFGNQGDRIDWIEKMGVPVIKAGESCDVLYWIGCCTTFDPTKQRIAEDLCNLLELCGINFGILGDDERCCGDPARLMGEERLFQEIAKAQVERIKARKFN